VANRDGSNPHRVTSKLDRDVSYPRWAADGKGIFFAYADQGDTKFTVVPSRTTGIGSTSTRKSGLPKAT
jgi:Tol biopolymer transport system component